MAAVAKPWLCLLGILHFQRAGADDTKRLAKKASIACATDATVFDRQLSDTRCSRSLLFETYPNSISTEGTSGALSTLKPADFSGCLCIRTVAFISFFNSRAK